MYEALYRKYRPKTFDDVVGQANVTETLKQQVKSGRLSHAYLFIGTRGTGKTTCARILAKAVNCEHPINGNPCNECASCRGIESGDILDVVELDAASNNGVDDVRLMRDEAIFSPTTVKKRVYIIDEVHMLSKPAFNALLKILEEPPEHLMFILATTEANKVLPTILSRCQRHSFRRLDSITVAERLSYVAKKEGIHLESDAAELLGRLADGGMRDGLSLLDQCSGNAVINTDTVLDCMGLAGSLWIQEMFSSIVQMDAPKTVELFHKLWQDGKDPESLLNELSGIIRDALMIRLASKCPPDLLSGNYDPLFISGLTVGNAVLIGMLDKIVSTLSSMRSARNPRLAVELCLIEMCGMEKSASPVPTAPAPNPIESVRVKQPTFAHTSSAPSVPFAQTDSAKIPPVSAKLQATEEPAFVPEQPVSSDSTSNSDDGWSPIAKQVMSLLPPGISAVVDDPEVANFRLAGNQLTLRVEPAFITICSTASNQEKIKNAVQTVIGKPILLNIIPMDQNDSILDDKLDSLKRFPNVSFIDG